MLAFLRVLTVIIQIISAVTTYQGFHQMGRLSSGLLAKEAVPVLMAIAGALVSIYLWWALFAWYPKADEPTRKKLNWAIVCGSLVIFGLSTLWSVMGLGGNTALQHHMQKVVSQAEVSLNNLSAEVEQEQTLAASAGMLQKQFDDLAGFEEKGAFSRFSGEGEVAIQLQGLSRTLANVQTTVSSSIGERRATLGEAREAIASLREILDRDLDMEVRTRQFAEKLATLNQLFQKIQSGESVQLVKQATGQLDKLAATKPPAGDQSAVASGQREAMERLTRTITSAQKILSRSAEDITAHTDGDGGLIKPLSSIDVGTAILRYAYAIVPAWCGALALDYFPLLFVFILYWTRGIREEEENGRLRREVGLLSS